MKQIPENIYADNFVVKDNCLYDVRTNRQGSNERKLCNFVPWLVREVTMDDGVETTTRIALAGVHESGRKLPVVEIDTEDLSSFTWLNKHWGIDCIIEPGTMVKDVIRYAIQTTAHNAERSTVYTVTGWREMEDGWQFLMPGDDAITVSLPSKMQGYTMEHSCAPVDIATSLALLDSKVAPPEILFPMLAFTFLTPLNHFLKLAGHEPKFVLFLVGKTGSRKSTLAALFLSFFGKFTGTELPLSFRDTGNSILHHAFSLKDVLTCIDDFHPAGRQEENRLAASAQSVMRAYGDRTGRGRLRADSSPMEARPPQGNAILTGEFPPDIGESGTARYFSLEMHDGDVNLADLTMFQEEASKGALQRCMFSFVEWLKECCLCTKERETKFIAALKKQFEARRSVFQKECPNCHGRVPESAAWLEIGMELYLSFTAARLEFPKSDLDGYRNQLHEILVRLCKQQAENVRQDRPTHKFIRKLYALLESGQCCLLNRYTTDDYIPPNCIGYEDDMFIFLHSEPAHKLVRKFCAEQGESFLTGPRVLMNQLAEEGLLSPTEKQNTNMNLKFDQNFSMDELMERNRHPHMRQAEPEQTTMPTPSEPEVKEHHVVINWTMPESMERIENRLKTLEEQNVWQTEYLRRISEKPVVYATQAQMDELLKAVKHLEQMTEQAGKPKEKSSLRRRIKLPRLHLSLPEWDWPTVVTVVMALAMAALLLLWWKSGGDWSSLSLLRR